MKQLTIQQCEEVNGGIFPILLMPVSAGAIWAAGALSAAIGFTAGAFLTHQSK